LRSQSPPAAAHQLILLSPLRTQCRGTTHQRNPKVPTFSFSPLSCLPTLIFIFIFILSALFQFHFQFKLHHASLKTPLLFPPLFTAAEAIATAILMQHFKVDASASSSPFLAAANAKRRLHHEIQSTARPHHRLWACKTATSHNKLELQQTAQSNYLSVLRCTHIATAHHY
jgi:hypothetical protein